MFEVIRTGLILLGALGALSCAAAAPAESSNGLLHKHGGGGGPPPPAPSEEFLGPFASWGNVKTDYGATGNGIADDTTAIQNALDHVGFGSSCAAGSGCKPVLYFPATGTNCATGGIGNFYKITRTVYLRGQNGVGLIGADPANTCIRWAGGASNSTAASFTGAISAPSSNSSGFWDATLTVTPGSGTVGVGQVLRTGMGANNNSTYIEAVTGSNTYLITAPGVITAGSGISMISAWNSGVFFTGNTASRFDRITIDGQTTLDVALDISWDGANNFFPTANEMADDIFQNTGSAADRGIGIACGFSGGGCSETTILRDKFINNNHAGVELDNFNALDIWVWYSLFQGNGSGVFSGAGNFHVFGSNFLSNGTDLVTNNGGIWNFRNNYSSGSTHFYTGGIGPGNINMMMGNTILNTGSVFAVRQNDSGPFFFAGNTVQVSPTATPDGSLGNSYNATVAAGPYVVVGSNNGSPVPQADVFGYNNSFFGTSLTSACTLGSSALWSMTPGCQEVGDTYSASSVSPPVPTLPVTPQSQGRTVYEAAPGGGGSTCSVASPCTVAGAITAAQAGGTTCPVVHVQAGTHNITSTTTVPANLCIQIVGDGWNSILSQSGGIATPIMQLLGPSKAILSDFQCNTNGVLIDCIEVDTGDGVGSRVFIDEVLLGAQTNDMFAEGLAHTLIEWQNSTAANAPIVATGAAPLHMFLGTIGGGNPSFQVSGGSNTVLQGFWRDTGGGPGYIASVAGGSTFTYAGSEIGLVPLSTSTFAFNSFTGTAALIGLHVDVGDNSPNPSGCNGLSNCAAITLDGGSTGFSLLGLGLYAPGATYFNHTNNVAGTTEFINSFNACATFSGSCVAGYLANAPSSPNTTFINNTLAQLMAAQPIVPAPLASGVTDVRIYRVETQFGRYGIHVKP